MTMTKKEIIKAIKDLAWNSTLTAGERQEALSDIEIAAQDELEKLEDRHSPR